VFFVVIAVETSVCPGLLQLLTLVETSWLLQQHIPCPTIVVTRENPRHLLSQFLLLVIEITLKSMLSLQLLTTTEANQWLLQEINTYWLSHGLVQLCIRVTGKKIKYQL
jgi:hypothetical protein